MIRNKAIFLVLFIFVLAGCSQQNNNGSATFNEGVSIDVSQYDNEEKYKPILKELEQNLNALVKKDKTTFEKGFVSQTEADANMFWIEDPETKYQFFGVPVIVDQESELKRIDIQVQYRTSKSIRNDEKGTTYNFIKNDQGEWKIKQID
jgi:ABC-type phosphate/phosphonate transport system substrate-binding protein